MKMWKTSLAVLAKSAGSYHWTPEGRKLADFSSGVLVMNLGHNPTRWWRRVKDYLGLHNLKEADEFPNHAGESGTQDFRRSVPGTIASMLRKPLDDVVVRL